MTLYDYQMGLEIAMHDYPFYALIQAAMRQADTDNLEKLREAFPHIWNELQLRYKASGGKDEFSWAGKPPSNEMWVSNYDGRVTRFIDGKLATEVPQPPLISSLAHTFPVVQMLDQLVSNYELNKGEQLNPDGTPKYPLELWQRLWNMWGVKTKIANMDDLKMQEQRMVRSKIMELKNLWKRASPEQKVYIEGILNDYSYHGQYRDFKEYD